MLVGLDQEQVDPGCRCELWIKCCEAKQGGENYVCCYCKGVVVQSSSMVADIT